MKAIIEWMNKDREQMCRSEQGYQIGKSFTISNPFSGVRIVRNDGSVLQDFTDAVNSNIEEIRVTIIHTEEDEIMSAPKVAEELKVYSWSDRIQIAITLILTGKLS
jgi:hypothetical protein